MLHALAVGMGRDPLDRDELPFVYERNLKVIPTPAPRPPSRDPDVVLEFPTRRDQALLLVERGGPRVVRS